MTDADSWDTCVLGYMCTRSILLAKDSPSPSLLNRPVEQAGGEAVWRGSASRRQPGAEAQSGFPIRGLPCSLGAPAFRPPRRSSTTSGSSVPSSGRVLRAGPRCRRTAGASVLRSLCSIPCEGRSYVPRALDPFHLSDLAPKGSLSPGRTIAGQRAAGSTPRVGPQPLLPGRCPGSIPSGGYRIQTSPSQTGRTKTSETLLELRLNIQPGDGGKGSCSGGQARF